MNNKEVIEADTNSCIMKPEDGSICMFKDGQINPVWWEKMTEMDKGRCNFCQGPCICINDDDLVEGWNL